MGTRDKKENTEKPKVDKKVQFSKVWLTVIMSCSIIWISFSYILAFLDKTEIAQELSDGIVKVVIATIVAYFLKSYFETNAEEKMKFEYMKMNNDSHNDNPEMYDDSDEEDP